MIIKDIYKPSKGVRTKINHIEILEGVHRCLLVHTDFFVESYDIIKYEKTQDMEGHTEAILKVIVLEPSKM